MDGPTAKSLILDLLSTLKEGSMPVSALVEAGGLFAIEGNAIRVAVTRLLSSGEIFRDERGRYRLSEAPSAGSIANDDRSKAMLEGPTGLELFRPRAGSWKRLELRVRRWTGAWLAVLLGAGDHAGSRSRKRGLEVYGLRALRPGFWLRPANLRIGLEGVRRELQSVGLSRADLVFEIAALDAEAERRSRELWDIDGVRSDHDRLRAELERSGQQILRLPLETAMVESFLLGGRAIRQLVRDPLLPEELCPVRERVALSSALRDYDRLGRMVWADFLRRHDVPYLRAPLDTRPASFIAEERV